MMYSIWYNVIEFNQPSVEGRLLLKYFIRIFIYLLFVISKIPVLRLPVLTLDAIL